MSRQLCCWNLIRHTEIPFKFQFNPLINYNSENLCAIETFIRVIRGRYWTGKVWRDLSLSKALFCPRYCHSLVLGIVSPNKYYLQTLVLGKDSGNGKLSRSPLIVWPGGDSWACGVILLDGQVDNYIKNGWTWPKVSPCLHKTGGNTGVWEPVSCLTSVFLWKQTGGGTLNNVSWGRCSSAASDMWRVVHRNHEGITGGHPCL